MRGGGADIRVIGLVMGTHVIEDIGMDVPHGVTVIIPADKAARSKDLWRSISQRCLFKLPSAAPPSQQAPVAVKQDAEAIKQRLDTLESRNASLEHESRALRQQLAQAQDRQQQVLEAILGQLQKQPQVVQVTSVGGSSGSSVARGEVADGSAPTFIPNQIKPEDAQTRIDTKESTSDSNVSSVADRLKRLKQQQGQ